jgi:hypothetical protein
MDNETGLPQEPKVHPEAWRLFKAWNLTGIQMDHLDLLFRRVADDERKAIVAIIQNHAEVEMDNQEFAKSKRLGSEMCHHWQVVALKRVLEAIETLRGVK